MSDCFFSFLLSPAGCCFVFLLLYSLFCFPPRSVSPSSLPLPTCALFRHLRLITCLLCGVLLSLSVDDIFSSQQALAPSLMMNMHGDHFSGGTACLNNST
jgi:hypothetical protein